MNVLRRERASTVEWLLPNTKRTEALFQWVSAELVTD